ncbi:MAG: hypothetical protein COV36_05765 [Alphaproteobacteria bacterium CG11_big_fil_rev_8_21_14_0_20_44_7]|nr:MAG: hypothetical protein COV36_05765 [Alphaproteobacteria bacterium CG11_big_fil_rev_8_21_14_0_20_44_7]
MRKTYLIALCTLLVAGCSGIETDSSNYPKSAEDERFERQGKLTGEGGLKIFGGGEEDKASNSGIGVNSFLWRATLDTIGFMPIQTADPFGGVITTDWYEDPAAKGEKLKINALIMDDRLRSDGVRITLFKQKLDEGNIWRDETVSKESARKIEDAILTRARELRVKQTGR